MPQPREAPQPVSAFVEVPYPPPPAHVETVPERPRDDALWIDGQWLWEGNRWVWDPGGWTVVPRGASFARWETRRAPDGRLFFAAASWRDASGHEIPPPPLIAPAPVRTSGGSQEASP